MNLFKKMLLNILMHEHKYDKVLAATAFAATKNAKNVDPDILRYQGISSFYKSNWYHSKMCFELLTESDAKKSNDFVYLAFLHARQNEKEKAITAWCKSLDLNKHNKYANAALTYIRNKGRELNLPEDVTLDGFVPKPPRYFNIKKALATFLICLICVLIVAFGSFYITNKIIWYNQNKVSNRPELEKVYLEDFNPNIISSPKDNKIQFSYSENEIKTMFEKIKHLISQDKVVEAQILINQIKLSNASAQVKLKMDILKDFIAEPDYGFFKNVINYEEFIKNKPLYEDVYISWQGRVINKTLYKNKITYDLVLGNENAGTIDAIIPVVFQKAVTIKNNDQVLVFGKIAIDNETGKAFIDGHNIVRQ